MVGQNPSIALSNPTTTVNVALVPLVMTFPDGTVFDSTTTDPVCSSQGSASSLIQQSPVFNNYDYNLGGTSVGNTQFGDAFQRANYYQYTNPSGINPNYHVLLAPYTLNPIRISVPSGKGSIAGGNCGRLGQVEINWFASYLEATVFPQLASLGVLPSTLVVFEFYNVVGYDTSTSNCCVIGYHSAFNNPSFGNAIQTYAVADFDTTGDFGTIRDVAPLSHEVGEWIDDPFGNNQTPSWGHIGQVSGCENTLEAGDPITGSDIPIVMSNAYTYHVQELVFASWFYRQTPSPAINGWYSSNGTFTSPASGCGTTAPTATTTTLSLSPATLTPGATVNLSISVHAVSGSGTPSGTVRLVSASSGGTLATYTLSGGAVNASMSNLPSGVYNVTANYDGDANFSSSVSPPVSVSVGASSVSLSPSSISFGDQLIGQSSASRLVTLTNNGNAPVSGISISRFGPNAGEFRLTSDCPGTLDVNAACSLYIGFNPGDTGNRTATISIADSATGSPQTIALSGNGVTAVATLTISTGALTFGSQTVGTTSEPQNFTLTNSGSIPISISSIAFSGPNAGDFTGSPNCPASLSPGSSCSVGVSFRPVAPGGRTASVVISDSASGSPHSVALSGTGAAGSSAPGFSTDPTFLDFGGVTVGWAGDSKTITVTNTGTAPLTINSVSVTGANTSDFYGYSSCYGTFAPGATCQVLLTFAPKESGIRSASVIFFDNSTGAPHTVGVSGTGQ